MIEISLEVISKLEEMLHDHVGYAASKNAERILEDLQKQAELRGVTGTTIPLTIKVSVSAGDNGLRLTVDDVSWQVLQKVKDKDFYDVDWDPRQPNLPGLESEAAKPNPPVVEAKALPAHDDDDDADDVMKEFDMAAFLTTCQAGLNLMEACKHNVETIADANGITVLAPSPYGDSRVMHYAHGEWKLQVVPNVQETLEAADDGECIVFDVNGKLTTDTMEKLKKNGYGILDVTETDAVNSIYAYTNNGCWMLDDSFARNADGGLQMVNYLLHKVANDDCLLVDRVIFYGLK